MDITSSALGPDENVAWAGGLDATDSPRILRTRVQAVEEAFAFGFPTDVDAVMICEVAGSAPAAAEDAERATAVLREAGARAVRAAGDAEREGEVGGAEHHDRADRLQHAPQVRPGQGLTLRQRGVDARLDPLAAPGDFREGANLTGGPPALALQAHAAQACFGVCETREFFGMLEHRLADRGDDFLPPLERHAVEF